MIPDNLLAIFLLSEDDDDDEGVVGFCHQFLLKKKPTHDMILKRDEEGAYNMLIQKYLMTDDDKFRQYFRISPLLYHTILEIISNEITSTPCNRHPNPISPAQKLCLTLRLFDYIYVES